MKFESLLLAAGALLFAVPVSAQTVDGHSVDPELARPPAPRLPQGAYANQIIPALDATGHYITPNLALSKEQTIWHVRSALNVAALSCRDAQEHQTVAAYNALVLGQKAPLAAADAAVKAQYRKRFGAGFGKRYDAEMTKVYNFFAQIPAQSAFCAAAQAILAEAATIKPKGLSDFAAGALPRLEAPFTDFYKTFEAWRVADQAWRTRFATVSTSEVPAPASSAVASNLK